MNIEEAIKLLTAYKKRYTKHKVIITSEELHTLNKENFYYEVSEAIDIVLKELDRLQNKCIEYDTRICPERYIKGQTYMEDKILGIIKEQKAIYKYDNNKPKIIAIEELLNKLKEKNIR